MDQLIQNQTPIPQSHPSNQVAPTPRKMPKGVVDSEDKSGIIPTTLSPSQIGFFRRWGILLTIPLFPIGPFFYLLFVRQLYFVKGGIVYRSSRKYMTLMLLAFGIMSLAVIIKRGILSEL